MKQTLYGDILFLVNFTMDFLTLYVTAAILRYKINVAKTAAASAVGAVYGVAACFMGGTVIVQLAVNLAVSLLMCYMAYGRKRLTSSCALFYGIGFLLGGFMTAVYGFIGIPENKTVYADGAYRAVGGNIPLGWMAVMAALAAVAAAVGGRITKRSRTARKIDIAVNIENKSHKTTGISDSGNFLTDPSGNLPVILMTEKAFRSSLPEELSEIFPTDDVCGIAFLPEKYITRIRVIPAESIGGSSLLIGFMPDGVEIDGVLHSAVIAPSRQSSYDGCDALIPAVLSE